MGDFEIGVLGEYKDGTQEQEVKILAMNRK